MLTQNMDNPEQTSSSRDDINTPYNEPLSTNENSSLGEENITTSPNNNDTPSLSNAAVAETAPDENLDDEPDETLYERLWGLSEMFPEPMRDYAGKMTSFTKKGVSKLYTISCNAAWIIVSSAVILLAPPIFESERANLRELQMSQEKQVLLGPSVALGPKAARVKSN